MYCFPHTPPVYLVFWLIQFHYLSKKNYKIAPPMLYTLYYYSEVPNKKEHRRSKNKAFFQNNTKTQTISLISTFSKLFSNLTTQFCCAKSSIMNSIPTSWQQLRWKSRPHRHANRVLKARVLLYWTRVCWTWFFLNENRGLRTWFLCLVNSPPRV